MLLFAIIRFCRSRFSLTDSFERPVRASYGFFVCPGLKRQKATCVHRWGRCLWHVKDLFDMREALNNCLSISVATFLTLVRTRTLSVGPLELATFLAQFSHIKLNSFLIVLHSIFRLKIGKSRRTVQFVLLSVVFLVTKIDSNKLN